MVSYFSEYYIQSLRAKFTAQLWTNPKAITQTEQLAEVNAYTLALYVKSELRSRDVGVNLAAT